MVINLSQPTTTELSGIHVQQGIPLVFPQPPKGLLYHYASLQSFQKIISSKKIWSSELHYVNDKSEIRHFGKLLAYQSRLRLEDSDNASEPLKQFIEWTDLRLNYGPLLFASSFSEQGNLLSQWRGYCPNGVGVSLGFDRIELANAATNAGFELKKCIYNSKEQLEIASQFLDRVMRKCENPVDLTLSHPSQSFHRTFAALEDEFLQLASSMKHIAFVEESEWRIVSKAHHNYVEPDIHYRASRDLFVPYLEFALPTTSNNALSLKHVYVGPNPEFELTFNSVSHYLSKQGISPNFVTACGIPYRG